MSWYCYEKFFNHAVNAAVTAQRKFGNVPVYSFFHAFGTLMQGKLGKNDIKGKMLKLPLSSPAIDVMIQSQIRFRRLYWNWIL